MPLESHPFLSSSVWAYLPIILLSAVAVVWLVRQIRARPPRQDNADRIQESSYIRDKDISVYAGSIVQRQFPRYVMKFIRNGKSGRVLVEFSAFAGGYGGEWTARKTIVLREVAGFARDEEISGPLVSADSMDSKIWRWGGISLRPPTNQATNTDTDAGKDDSTPLVSRGFHRGRVVFQDEDGNESQRYFIITQSDAPSMHEMPNVTGGNQFDFIMEWEAEDDALNVLQPDPFQFKRR